ncbi:MAG: aminotransferase class V-fold PLP-dependent enzyme, partial [Nanoarchaeota archaeon]|nr:aminotransferase class V-fold PLP-dependent enzyme [Nanoarchaeota archaeon]
ITKNYELDYEKAKEIINDKTAILAITHVSNVFGTINNIKFLVSLAKEKKAITIIDAAQSIQHLKINVKKIGCDFLAFSGHKMFAPLGIGVLYGKREFLEKLSPFQFGGGMINSVSYEKTTLAEIPEKFEAGTQNYCGAIALAEAVKYIKKIGFEKIQKNEKELLDYALKKLSEIKKIKIYNSGKEKSISLISFNIQGIHPHDVAELLNENKIAIRAGHHCCMPLMKKLEIPGTCRISFSVYHTKEDINKLINALKKIQGVFEK